MRDAGQNLPCRWIGGLEFLTISSIAERAVYKGLPAWLQPACDGLILIMRKCHMVISVALVAQRSRKFPNVVHQQFGLFHRCKMAASGHLGPLLDVIDPVRIRARRPTQHLGGEDVAAYRHLDVSSFRGQDAPAFLTPAIVDPGGGIERLRSDVD